MRFGIVGRKNGESLKVVSVNKFAMLQAGVHNNGILEEPNPQIL